VTAYEIVKNLTSEVIEESVGEHSCHELFQKNGGRGLSDAHVAIRHDAINMGVKRPNFFINIMRTRAAELLVAGIIHFKLEICCFS
jgi:hypothetical protein